VTDSAVLIIWRDIVSFRLFKARTAVKRSLLPAVWGAVGRTGEEGASAPSLGRGLALARGTPDVGSVAAPRTPASIGSRALRLGPCELGLTPRLLLLLLGLECGLLLPLLLSRGPEADRSPYTNECISKPVKRHDFSLRLIRVNK